MNYSNLRLLYRAAAAADALPANWVRLEQNSPPAISQYASLRDIYRLWLAAATGTSARTLRATDCPVEFEGADVRVYLGFWAWPSDPLLPFELAPALGALGEWQKVAKPREFSRFVDNASRLDLPYYMEEVSTEWETPCFDRFGARIQSPAIINHHTWLEFSSEVFAALRISGPASGVYVVCEMVLSRPLVEEEITPEEQAEQRERDEAAGLFLSYQPPQVRLNGYKVENLENTITASWLSIEGKTETEQLPLEIPQCVQAVLQFCPDMYQTILLWCDEIATRQVYYNTCTDPAEVIAIFDGVDPRSYCTRTVVGDNFNPRDLV